LVITVKGGGCGNGGDDHGDNEDDEEEYCYGLENRSGWWKRNCSYRNSDSFAWIFLQISWRAVLSLCIALLVFYVATKPPPPKVSIQVRSNIQQSLSKKKKYSILVAKLCVFIDSSYLIHYKRLTIIYMA